MKDDSKGLLQERDKHETICPSQRKFNVFWRLWVSWWDHSRGTKLLERNLRATQSCRLQRGKKKSSSMTTHKSKRQNGFSAPWSTLLLAKPVNVTKRRIRHGCEKTSMCPRWEERKTEKQQNKDGLIYEVWWSLSVAANSRATSIWQSKIWTASQLPLEWHLIPSSLCVFLKVWDLARNQRVICVFQLLTFDMTSPDAHSVESMMTKMVLYGLFSRPTQHALVTALRVSSGHTFSFRQRCRKV